jgi:hypothetical protein
MIESIAKASRSFLEAPRVSRQKKDALFEQACRVALVAQEARSSDKAIDKAVVAERRKLLKAALAMVASGASAEDIEAAMAAQPKAEGGAEGDPGIELERAMVDSGCRALARNEHYSVVMRRMTAFLGPEYFDKAEAWLLERSKRRRGHAESLVVPGELPDVIRILAMDKRNLERAMRASGRDIATAALAGCPQESMDLVRPLYGRVGAAALEDEAAHLRSKLSGDEIAQAQAAFLEVLRNLEERGELRLGPEDELSADPAFVAALTRAVLGLDTAVIKGAFRLAEGALVATAMQGMEPQAHDRILEALSKKEMRRILNAIDDADPLPRHAVQGAGRELAARLFETAAAAKSPRAELERLAVVRDWES